MASVISAAGVSGGKTVPTGALVVMNSCDDHVDGIYHAYGIVCGECEYEGCCDEHDENGDRIFGAYEFRAPGYKLLILGCTNTNHVCYLGTFENVAQKFVRLVKPGEVAKALERWLLYEQYAHDPEWAVVGDSLRMLIGREAYARRREGGWARMFPGTDYPGPVESDEQPNKRAKKQKLVTQSASNVP